MDCPPFNLSDEQISFIRDDVGRSGITFSHLEEELIDHLCCIVEDYLGEGYNFEEAYVKVKKSVAFSELKDIEIQTLLLINKKLRIMKTTLKITGIVGFIGMLLGSFFKVMHWPGAGIIIFASMLILILGYIPVLSLTIKKEKILKRKTGLINWGIISAFFILTTLLFTYMHWPLKNYLILASWISILIFIVFLFRNILKSEDNKIIPFSLILFIVIIYVFNIALYFSSFNNPRLSNYALERNIEATTDFFSSEAVSVYERIHMAGADSLDNNAFVLKEKSDQIISQIRTLQAEIFSDNEEMRAYQKKLFGKHVISRKVENEAKSLEQDISEYRNFILASAADDNDLLRFIETNIQFGRYDFNNEPQVIYNNLERLERDITIAEYKLMNEYLAMDE